MIHSSAKAELTPSESDGGQSRQFGADTVAVLHSQSTQQMAGLIVPRLVQHVLVLKAGHVCQPLTGAGFVQLLPKAAGLAVVGWHAPGLPADKILHCLEPGPVLHLGE